MGEVPKGGKLCYIHQADFGPFVWPVEEMREPDLAALTDFLVFYMFFVCFLLLFWRVLVQSPTPEEKAQGLLWHVHSASMKKAAINACLDLCLGSLDF